MAKNVLGRGVDALLPDEEIVEEKYFMCDIDKISPNPQQPRSYFDPEKLEQLADSIREKGIIQPLLVTRGRSRRYSLIAGERRLRAAKLAGLDEVPVVLLDETGDRERLELALIENIQRHDLNPIEEAQAYSQLLEDFQLTQEEVAKRVGRQRSTITNVLRLLQLPENVQEDVVQGKLSEGHARVLLRVKEQPALLQSVRDKIVNDGLSVRAAERLCATPAAKTSTTPARTNAASGAEQLPAEYCQTLTTQLTNQLHTKVRIVQQGARGKLEIDYYSTDDLDRLMGLLTR